MLIVTDLDTALYNPRTPPPPPPATIYLPPLRNYHINRMYEVPDERCGNLSMVRVAAEFPHLTGEALIASHKNMNGV